MRRPPSPHQHGFHQQRAQHGRLIHGHLILIELDHGVNVAPSTLILEIVAFLAIQLQLLNQVMGLVVKQIQKIQEHVILEKENV